MNKLLKNYLILQSFVGSMALAVELPVELNEPNQAIVRKALARDYLISWEEVKGEDTEEQAQLIHDFLEQNLAEKLKKCTEKITLVDLTSRAGCAKHKKLSEKIPELTEKQDYITESYSAWFLLRYYQQQGIESQDLKITERIRDLKTKIEKRREEKEEEKIQEKNMAVQLKRDLHLLEEELKKVPNAEAIKAAATDRAEEGMQMWRSNNLEGHIHREAQKHLERLNSLDECFLSQIQSDAKKYKVQLPENVTLVNAMGLFSESVQSYTALDKINGNVKRFISEALTFLGGNELISFDIAKENLSRAAKALNNQDIPQRLNYVTPPDFLPNFEFYVRAYCYLTEDFESLIYSQMNACKNGLNGRVLYFTKILLEAQLKEGLRDFSKFEKIVSENEYRQYIEARETERERLKKEIDDFCAGEEFKRKKIENSISEVQELLAIFGSDEGEVSEASSMHSLTFRTTGANEAAEIKHSAVYASFSYQNNPGAAYSLIINHRTKDKGSEVRVFNPNTKTYINLGRLSPSMGFSDQVFNVSSLFASTPTNSSGPSIMKTELNFTGGISDIHSFTIKSGKERLMEVILGDQDSEKQTGVYVYAPEISEKLQEWSEVRSGDI